MVRIFSMYRIDRMGSVSEPLLRLRGRAPYPVYPGLILDIPVWFCIDLRRTVRGPSAPAVLCGWEGNRMTRIFRMFRMGFLSEPRAAQREKRPILCIPG
jgi:hypothetical protein